MASIARLMRQAVKYHQSDAFEQAAALYQQVLHRKPAHADALHLLGMLYHSQGHHTAAEQFIQQAITTAPDNLTYRNNCAKFYQATAQIEKCQAMLDTILSRDETDRHALAVQCELLIADDLVGAERLIQESKLDWQHDSRLAFSYALFLQKKGDINQAVQVYETLRCLQPSHVACLNNLGEMYLLQHRIDDAMHVFHQAIALSPTMAALHFNLGMAYQARACNDKALSAFEQSIHLEPSAQAYCQAAICAELMQVDKAQRFFERALALAPNDIAILSRYWFFLGTCAQWAQQDAITEQLWACLLPAIQAGIAFECPHYVILLLAQNAEQQYRLTQGLARHFCKQVHQQNTAVARVLDRRVQTQRKLRIGLVSPDFSSHCVGFILDDSFRYRQSDQASILGFSTRQHHDTQYTRIAASFDTMINVSSMSDADAAACIAGEHIDILIDLTGYIGDHRVGLFERQPAPIQGHFLGDIGTLANPIYHYTLTDRFSTPESLLTWHTEKIIYLDGAPLATRLRTITPCVTRRDYGLPENAFIFCCFHHPSRIDRAVCQAWILILSTVPNSILWLHSSNLFFQQAILAVALEAKVSTTRIIFTPKERLSEHYCYQLADLYLGTWRYGGATTTLLCLMAGVPMLTLVGQTPQTRLCASLLQNAGCAMAVATSQEQYCNLAIRSARQRDFYQTLCAQFNAAKHSVVFDQRRYCQTLMHAFEAMATDHCQSGGVL